MEMGRTRRGQICCIEGQQKSDGTRRDGPRQGQQFQGAFWTGRKEKKGWIVCPIPSSPHSPSICWHGIHPLGSKGEGKWGKSWERTTLRQRQMGTFL
jgi:hypothetical protein